MLLAGGVIESTPDEVKQLMVEFDTSFQVWWDCHASKITFPNEYEAARLGWLAAMLLAEASRPVTQGQLND